MAGCTYPSSSGGVAPPASSLAARASPEFFELDAKRGALPLPELEPLGGAPRARRRGRRHSVML